VLRRISALEFLAAVLSTLLFSGVAAVTPAQAAAAQAAAAPQAGETAPPPTVDAPTTILHVKSSIVLLDVVVTDSKGNPVMDLKREDFRVFEDKQPQHISSFEPPEAHDLPAPARQNAPFNPDDTASYGDSPVTVLVLDELNTHFADTDFARRSIHDFLAARPATLNEPTMLLTLGDTKFQLLQNFTRNRDDLLKALANHKTSYSWKLEIGKSVGQETVDRLGFSVNALEQIAEYTARIPGRKNLVWVGQGFPSLDTSGLAPDDDLKLTAMLQHVTDTLLATRVTLYAIDPTSNAVGMTEITDADQLQFSMATGGSAGRLMDPFDQQLDFDRLGPVTGGRVLRGQNDISHLIDASVQLGEHYYTIGYSPTDTSNASQSFRKITVKCLRPGTTVQTRDGYYPGVSKRQKSTETLSTDLNAALSAELLYSALHIRVEPLGNDQYSIHVIAPGLTWTTIDSGPDVGKNTAQAEVLGASLSAKGSVLAHTMHTMTATAAATANVHSPSLPADFAIALARPKGTAKMRFVVRDATSGAMGSFDLILP
jgi:VWFA-related protein